MISVQEEIRASGRLKLKIIRGDNLICEQMIKNLIVMQGRHNAACLLGGGTGMHVSHIGVGSGRDEAQSTDTGLTNAVKVAVTPRVATGLEAEDGSTFDDPKTVQFHFRIGKTAANIAIGEYGLFCADGTLFSRIVRESVFNKTNLEQIVGFWQIEF